MKKLVALFLSVIMIIGMLPAVSLAANTGFNDGYTYIVLTAEQFENTGNWVLKNDDTYPYLFGGYNSSDKSSYTPATIDIKLPKDGSYKMHSFSKHFGDTTYKKRYYNMTLGENTYQTANTYKLGGGWNWQASSAYEMAAGTYTFTLTDTKTDGYNGRFAMAVITDDPNFSPGKNATNIAALKEFIYSDRSLFKDDCVYIVLDPESFAETGNWASATEDGYSRLFGGWNGADSTTTTYVPAKASIGIKKNDTYKISTFSKDYDANPGSRYFNVSIGGNTFKTADKGITGWHWESTPSFNLQSDVYDFEMSDDKTTGYNGRCAYVVITNDLDFRPTASAEDIAAISELVSRGSIAGGSIMDESKYTYIILGPDGYTTIGNWKKETDGETGFDYLYGGWWGANPETDTYTPASIEVGIPKDGNYFIHTLSKDYSTSTGARYFDVALGEKVFRAGSHGKVGWHWQSTDSFPILAGYYDFQLIDDKNTGFQGRCAAAVITDDPYFTGFPSSEYVTELLEKQFKEGDIDVNITIEGRPQTDIAVRLNDEWMSFDAQPIKRNGLTYVQYDTFLNALNFNISFADDNTIIAERNNFKIKFSLDKDILTIGNQPSSFKQPVIAESGTYYVPIETICNAADIQMQVYDNGKTFLLLASTISNTLLFTPKSVSDNGTWELQKENNEAFGSFNNEFMMGNRRSDASTQEPAIINFNLEESGTYRIWARSRDYAAQQGSRYFQISVNDDALMEQKYGTHGIEGFKWATGGTIDLSAGQNTIKVHNSSNYMARWDAILITKDLDFVPYENYNFLTSIVHPYSLIDSAESIPTYATELETPTESTTISNDTTKVVFYKVPTSNGQVIQNEIYSKSNGQWVLTKGRDETLAYPVMKATAASNSIYQEMYQLQTSYELNGTTVSNYSTDPYISGAVNWFIPTDFTTSASSAAAQLDFEPFTLTVDRVGATAGQNRLVIKNKYLPAWALEADMETTMLGLRVKGTVLSTSGGTLTVDTVINEYDIRQSDGETVIQLASTDTVAATGTSKIGTDWNVMIYPFDKTVTLTFPENDIGTLTATWSLDDNTMPKVSVDATFDEAGYYSIGASEGGEFTKEEVEFALAPYHVQYKRIPKDAYLIPEHILFTPMGTYTLPENNKYSELPVTKGIVAEPSWIPLRWVYSFNNQFGITVKNENNMCESSIFAPVMGTPESLMEAGESYNLQYRVVSRIGTWFENYQDISTNLFNVHDYRENYKNTLNDVIFNARGLMMDDEYGGWDPYSKGFYNMEYMSQVSMGNPVQPLQEYMLTEDEEILTNRAIPTLANLLTRGDIHFNRTGLQNRSEDVVPPDPIGTPIEGFNANVIGGIYEMTRGAVPYLHQYALEKGEKTVTNSYGSIAPFINDLAMYKYTGSESYLNAAIKKADKYLEEKVYTADQTMRDYADFIYISYYPNLASLIDIYEATGYQRYLDAAVDVARWMSTGLWVPGIDSDKLDQKVTANDRGLSEQLHGLRNDGVIGELFDFYYDGLEKREVLPTTNVENITSRYGEVDSGLVSRVGLGIEQSLTFTPASNNIVMQYFVGDFMKLSAYTGDDYFATLAKNAILGRFTSYHGYSVNAYYTYPYEVDVAREGPDSFGFYQHHIPTFLAMLEDFLFGQTMALSNNHIHFPSFRQQGYAYFNSNQYGHEPGTFYDQKEMWPWLDEGIVSTDNIQLDWLAARKDGVLGLAFMNESHSNISSTVTLGDKIPNASTYSGTADLYDATGKIGTVTVTNGKFRISVPAKKLVAVVLKINGVKAPSFASLQYSDTYASVNSTVSTHTSGKGYTLQMNPDSYYAYVYSTYNTPMQVKGEATNDHPVYHESEKPYVNKLTINYNIGGGEEQTAECSIYPFEFIIKVDDPTKEFNYTLTATYSDGTTKDLGGSTLYPAAAYEPFKITVKGFGGSNLGARLRIAKDTLPYTPLVGMKVNGWVVLTDGRELEYDADVISVEDDGTDIVITMKATTPSFSGTLKGYEVSLYPKNYNLSSTNISAAKTGNGKYTLSTSKAQPVCYIKTSTDSSGKLQIKSIETSILQVSSPVNIELAENESMFLWEGASLYKGTNMKPLYKVLTY